MKIFRSDGQPSRDDECEHGFRRFEKCPHCLEADNARLRVGRPPLDIKTRTYNILLAEAQYEWLMRHAYRQGMSGAAVIRGLLDELRARTENGRAAISEPAPTQQKA